MTKASGEVGGRGGHHLLTGSSRYELNKEAGVNLEHTYVSNTYACSSEDPVAHFCSFWNISTEHSPSGLEQSVPQHTFYKYLEGLFKPNAIRNLAIV